MLFKAASLSLKKVSQNPKFLGTETGAVAVLHTWGQALTYHPHIHMIIPAGGLSADGVEWIKAGRKFFLPVKALSKIFRGVMWGLLKKEIALNNIKLPDDMSGLDELNRKLYEKNWNVFTQKSMAGPQSVLKYLGKYTHRVAISNNRIISIGHGKVTFRWKDYRKGLENKLLQLDAEEFIGRFLRHVLPSGFYKIRYYGLLAAVNVVKRQQCASLINQPVHVSILEGMSTMQVLKLLTGKDPSICPKCGNGKMVLHSILDSG
jgi:CYTH domain-containing protein